MDSRDRLRVDLALLIWELFSLHLTNESDPLKNGHADILKCSVRNVPDQGSGSRHDLPRLALSPQI